MNKIYWPIPREGVKYKKNYKFLARSKTFAVAEVTPESDPDDTPNYEIVVIKRFSHLDYDDNSSRFYENWEGEFFFTAQEEAVQYGYGNGSKAISEFRSLAEKDGGEIDRFFDCWVAIESLFHSPSMGRIRPEHIESFLRQTVRNHPADFKIGDKQSYPFGSFNAQYYKI